MPDIGRLFPMRQGHAVDYTTKRRRFAMSLEPHYWSFFPRNFLGPRSYGETRKLSSIDLGYVKFTKGSLVRVVGLGLPWTPSRLIYHLMSDAAPQLTRSHSTNKLIASATEIAVGSNLVGFGNGRPGGVQLI